MHVTIYIYIERERAENDDELCISLLCALYTSVITFGLHFSFPLVYLYCNWYRNSWNNWMSKFIYNLICSPWNLTSPFSLLIAAVKITQHKALKNSSWLWDLAASMECLRLLYILNFLQYHKMMKRNYIIEANSILINLNLCFAVRRVLDTTVCWWHERVRMRNRNW